MQAVILAGGRGERLKPLTDSVPKPMVIINGRPFLEYQLNLIKDLGISRVLLLTGYLSEKIYQYFGSGRKFNLKIEYSVEDKPLGTGGAIKNAENLLEEMFLILNGDTYLKVNFQDLAGCFKKSDSIGMLCIGRDKLNNVKGNIAIDRDFFITSYKKNASPGELSYIDAGCGIFRKSLADYIPEGKKVSLEEEVLPGLIDKRLLKGYLTEERFYDIGSFLILEEARKVLK